MANILYEVVIQTNPIFEVIVNNGAKGDKGEKGDTGSVGEGVPDGGYTNQYLVKLSNTDYNVDWKTITSDDVAYGDGTATEGLDNRYTKGATDILLGGKSDTTHLHTGTYSPVAHTHDDRYYTESETVILLGDKVDKITGKGLSTNDFTDDLETKLSGIEASANNYALPTATDSILGGIKVGSRLSILSGVLSADVQTTDISGKVDKVAGSSLVADTTITDLTDSGDTSLHYHSADRSVDNHTDGTTNKLFTATLKTKLDGIATGAVKITISADAPESPAENDLWLDI